MTNSNQSISSKFPVKNIIVLVIFFSILFLAYRSCTKGYDQYGVFVQVTDEAVFDAVLDPKDSRIIDRGRRLIDEIKRIDNDIDNGDGPHKGRLRWYVCSGIDCEEGWERGFFHDGAE